LGYFSPRTLEWDARCAARLGSRRHHLAVDEEVGAAFWRCFLAGESLEVARRVAGVSRSTGYRWLQRRFLLLREQGIPVQVVARQLRVPPARARAWEAERREAREHARRERGAAERRAVRESARHAELMLRGRAPRSDVVVRDTRYWQFMRSGMTNAAALTPRPGASQVGVRHVGIWSGASGPARPSAQDAQGEPCRP
jgi:transposase, IS30 family